MIGIAATLVGIAAAALMQAPGPADATLERMTFVVEFADGRVTNHPVGPRRGSSWTPMFPRIPGWQPAPGDLWPTAVNCTFHRTNEGVRFAIGVFLGEAHEREITLHEGTLRLGERIVVDRFVEYGIRPIAVALEPLPAIDFHEPAITNRTSGLQIVAIGTTVDPAPRYVVTVENLTDRGADGFWFESRLGGRTGHSGSRGNQDGTVLVPPRGTYTFDFPLPTGPPRTGGSWAPLPADELVLTSVTWMDGSFEGEPRAAAVHRLRLMARRVQVERVTQALGPALRDSSLGRALGMLRRNVDGLSIQVDSSLERAGMALLPTDDVMPREDVIGVIRSTLQRVKSQASDELTRIEGVAVENGADAARQELQTMGQEFDTWLKQLQR